MPFYFVVPLIRNKKNFLQTTFSLLQRACKASEKYKFSIYNVAFTGTCFKIHLVDNKQEKDRGSEQSTSRGKGKYHSTHMKIGTKVRSTLIYEQ